MFDNDSDSPHIENDIGKKAIAIIQQKSLLALGKPSSNSCWGHSGIAGKGGGVSTLARMVWGTFLEKNLPRSNGHLLD